MWRQFESANLLSVMGFLLTLPMAYAGGTPKPGYVEMEPVYSRLEKGALPNAATPGEKVRSRGLDENPGVGEGATCVIRVHNRTNLLVNRVYVDGYEHGPVQPYNALDIADVQTGLIALYAEVDNVDQSVDRFGPQVLDCKKLTILSWVLGN